MAVGRYAYGQSAGAQIRAARMENAKLRAALAEAITERNKWQTLFLREQGAARRLEGIKGSGMEHGSGGYRRGCRCAICREDQRRRNQENYRNRKARK